MLLILSIVAPLAAAALSRFLAGISSSRLGWILAGIPALLFLGFAWQVGSIDQARGISVTYAWIPSLDVSLDLRLDGLGLLFALLISGIGALIFIYADGYLGRTKDKGRFYAFLLLFMTGMLGLCSADNLVLFFVFWELTSISSYLLIGFKHESQEARWKALQALLVTGAGGVAMLAGFILLAEAGNSYRFTELIAQGPALAETRLGQLALPLILLGAFTKSAQFPFHFWLPNAMAAPTPVSAYLHSATMVKAGVFLLFKLSPLYAASSLWQFALIGCGSITLVYGATSGLFQKDLKRILAFTTMAVLGLLVMLIGMGNQLALKSALLFMLGHALYKATLFMTAGSIDHSAGTRDVRLLGGLRNAMPWTALAAGLAALSKGGFPPLLGFVSKEYVYKASSGLEALAPWLTAVALIGNVFLLALAFKAGFHPFWASVEDTDGRNAWSRHLPRVPHEVSFAMAFGPLLLATLGIFMGLFPNLWTSQLVGPALSSAVGAPAEAPLALWHGFNVPLLLSLATMAAGIAVYLLRQRLWRNETVAQRISEKDTERIYDFVFAQFVAQSKRFTRLLQNGSLRFYLWTILGTASLLIGYKLLILGGLPQTIDISGIGLFEIILGPILIVAIGYAAFAPTLLRSLAGLGLAGYGIALLFAFNGAPDLAITQIVVETLTVALILFAALTLPRFGKYSGRRARLADVAFASVFGLLIFAMALKANNLQLAPTISHQLAEWSYLEAKGKNVVNVILVDFRALDTFGEIVVLGIAAIGASLCLRVYGSKRFAPSRGARRAASPILQTGARWLFPICIVLSLLALYRGHNEPGGGFIGGLIAAAGYLLFAFAFGPSAASRRLILSTPKLIAGGLLVAVLSGLLGPAFGQPFLTGYWLPAFTLPVLGTVHLGTPLVFDVGVYLTVLGFTLQTAFAFHEASEATVESVSPEDKPAQTAATR